MDNTILKKAENQVRQQLFGGLALLVAALMIGNTSGWVALAENTDVTNMTFNVTAGTLSILNAPASAAFPSQAYGVSNNIASNEATNGLVIMDYRGTSTAWDMTVSSTEMNDGGTNIIAATRLKIDNNGVVVNIANATTAEVGVLATDGPLNDGGSTVLNGSVDASGTFGFNNARFMLVVTGTDATADYTGVVTYTVT